MDLLPRSLLYLLCLLPGVSLAEACLSFTPQQVQLHGQLQRQTHQGPNEKSHSSLYLLLPSPICVDGNDDEDAVSDVSLVQLALTPERAHKLESRQGQSIRLKGQLMGAHSAFHFAPLLLTQVAYEPTAESTAMRAFQGKWLPAPQATNPGHRIDAHLPDAVEGTSLPEDTTLPEDVRAFRDRHESCEHFIGEEPYDEERRLFLQEAVEESCTGIDAQLQALRARHAEHTFLSQYLSHFDTLE